MERINKGTLLNPFRIENNTSPIILEGGVYILVNAKIDCVLGTTIILQMRGSSQVNVMRESSQVKEMWESSQVKEMWGSSQVKEMRESSQVNVMRGSSQVNVMRGSSQVKEMRESSQVNVMRGSSQVNVMRESSQVKEMRGSSQVKEMWGSSQVNLLKGANTVVCFGYNSLRVFSDNVKNLKLSLNDTSILIEIPTIENNFDVYRKNYPVKMVGDKAILYKAVHKVGENYCSDYDRSFKYVIGELKQEKKTDNNSKNSCSQGIHVSHLKWAIDFGRNWSDMVILECEVDAADIIVSADCDGKVRTPKLLVLREVSEQECQSLINPNF